MTNSEFGWPDWLPASDREFTLKAFREFLDEQFPDGMGNGCGGSYCQDDIETTWLAAVGWAAKWRWE